MEIDRINHFRVTYGTTNGPKYPESHFFNVDSVEGFLGYAVEISTFESFGYCVVIKTNEQYFPHRIMFFPNKTWFQEWFDAQEIKPEILWATGKEKE